MEVDRDSASMFVKTSPSDRVQNHMYDDLIDITADLCPMTFVRTRLALDRLHPGQTLLVRLRGTEPVENVPRTAAEHGHTIAIATASDGVTSILIRKAGPG